MIETWKHKGLKELWKNGDKSGIQGPLEKRILYRLYVLENAKTIKDLNVDGFRLHRLSGKSTGRWSIWVNAQWRLTFVFDKGNVYDLYLENYH